MTAALTVAIVAKSPSPGAVKTRLTPVLTPAQAARLALCALCDTIDTVAGLDVDQRIVFLDGPLPPQARRPDFVTMPQPPGSLDERLAALCDAVPGPLLIVGMDTPQFGPADVAPALAPDLGGSDAWIGHAADGGFWALALRQPRGALVRGIPMSQPDTGLLQQRRLGEAGLAVGLLPVLTDFDVVEDLDVVAARAPGSRLARAWSRMSVRVPT